MCGEWTETFSLAHALSRRVHQALNCSRISLGSRWLADDDVHMVERQLTV